MKFALILLVFLTAILFECKKDTTRGENNMQDSKAVYSEKKQFGDLEFSLSAKILKKGLRDGVKYLNDYLSIDYEIRNAGSRDFVVYNRGHFGFDNGKNAVYVEPQSDGSVEISQKAFIEPKDKQCPLRLVAIVSQGSRLKAGQTIKEQISLELPPKLNTPFADCIPVPQMPAEIKRARFCVGAAEVLDRAKIRINADGIVQGRDGLGEQQLLCGDGVKIK